MLTPLYRTTSMFVVLPSSFWIDLILSFLSIFSFDFRFPRYYQEFLDFPLVCECVRGNGI